MNGRTVNPNISARKMIRTLHANLNLTQWKISFSISLVMLDMQADKDNCRTFEEASDCPGTASDSERVKLLSGGRLDHSVEFLEIKTGVAPKLLKGE